MSPPSSPPVADAARVVKPPTYSRPTWAEIDLPALSSNLGQLRGVCATGTGILAVIKANAYGHGAREIAHALVRAAQPPAMLAVASVDEGIELRTAGIIVPILLLSAILPAEVPEAVRAGLTVTLFSTDVVRALDQAGQAQGRPASAHFKIDTGMGRIGRWHEEAGRFYQSLARYPFVHVEGVYTHFASADETDDDLTPRQIAAFEAALRACGLPRPGGPVIHAANSATALRYPRADYDMIRPGLALYGATPLPPNLGARIALKPVMTLRARVTSVRTVAAGASVSYGATWRAARPSRVATVPVGYADGYSRRLSNRGRVLVHGRCCPVVGRVTMDQLLVDCTELSPAVNVGDPVTLWGCGLPIEDVAQAAETIPYELMCAVGKRVPRIYIED